MLCSSNTCVKIRCFRNSTRFSLDSRSYFKIILIFFEILTLLYRADISPASSSVLVLLEMLTLLSRADISPASSSVLVLLEMLTLLSRADISPASSSVLVLLEILTLLSRADISPASSSAAWECGTDIQARDSMYGAR